MLYSISSLKSARRSSEHGNMLFIIFIAIILVGALSAAIMSSSNSETSNIDRETLAIKASEVQRYASELERAILFIMSNGFSESDIRFAHPDAHADYGDLSADGDPTDQVFHRDGGGAAYREPPEDINDGSLWEFYAGTHLPGVGSNRAELIAVLPHVTQQFCEKINELNNQTTSPKDTGANPAAGADPGSCLNIGAVGRFDAGQQYYSATINTVDKTTFKQDQEASDAYTALQACVICSRDTNSANGLTDEFHFYHVILAR
ncbi:MAG: hypothetical protein KAJ86_01035 [Alphaproteobacteria bacterium]|nr:hypothetical protein [Alphaproteobacteria bacterium]